MVQPSSMCLQGHAQILVQTPAHLPVRHATSPARIPALLLPTVCHVKKAMEVPVQIPVRHATSPAPLPVIEHVTTLVEIFARAKIHASWRTYLACN